MNAVMEEFDKQFSRNLSKFNISFNRIGVRNRSFSFLFFPPPVLAADSLVSPVVTYIRQKHLADNILGLAYNILARTFYAVVALLEVEHRLRHCMPYAGHEIEFDLSANPPTNIGMSPVCSQRSRPPCLLHTKFSFPAPHPPSFFPFLQSTGYNTSKSPLRRLPPTASIVRASGTASTVGGSWASAGSEVDPSFRPSLSLARPTARTVSSRTLRRRRP